MFPIPRSAPARGKRGARVADNRGGYRGSVASQAELEKEIVTLEKQMFEHAKNLAFEEAAHLRDQIEELRQQFVRS